MIFQELIALTGDRVTAFQSGLYPGASSSQRISRLFVDGKLWITPMNKEEETFDKIFEMITSDYYKVEALEKV